MDEQCPQSEPYVGYVQMLYGNRLEINQVYIRRGDRMQFTAGTYFSGGFNPQCLLGKFTPRGDFEVGKYMTTPFGQLSECFALAYIQEVHNIVVVGRTYGYSNALGEWKYVALVMIID